VTVNQPYVVIATICLDSTNGYPLFRGVSAEIRSFPDFRVLEHGVFPLLSFLVRFSVF
jgi:hypothetical protein